jgi:hypothetical protein
LRFQYGSAPGNIGTPYARAEANGAVTVTPGCIMNSDVGGYIMLWQPK